MSKTTLKVIDNITPTHITFGSNVTRPPKEVIKDKLNSLIKEETRMVTGIFQCFETPGATVKITVKKYPGIPHFEMVMTDGVIYTVPLYVARHLNGVDASAGALGGNPNPNIGTCSYGVHGFKHRQGEELPASQMAPDGSLVPVVGITKRVKRFGFQSMEFAGTIV